MVAACIRTLLRLLRVIGERDSYAPWNWVLRWTSPTAEWHAACKRAAAGDHHHLVLARPVIGRRCHCPTTITITCI